MLESFVAGFNWASLWGVWLCGAGCATLMMAIISIITLFLVGSLFKVISPGKNTEEIAALNNKNRENPPEKKEPLA